MTEWIVSSVVLIVVVALVRQLLKGKISLRLQYALWAIVLVRLLVPITFGESKISVLNVLDQATSVVERQEPAEEPTVSDPGWEPIGGNSRPISSEPIGTPLITPGVTIHPDPVVTEQPESGLESEPPAVDEPSGAPLVSVAQLLTPFWLCGIMVVGLWFLFTNLRFWLRLRRSRRVLALDCPIRVYVTGVAETPCLFGLIRPAVYLTPEVAEDEVALRHVLAHELTHCRHWDHVWSVLRCVCLAVHWYNPLVWLAASLSRRDAELACDESTIRRIGEGERTAYGRTLIGLTCVHRSNLLHTATTMTGSKKSIKERIVLIAKKPKMAIYTLVAVILIAAIAVGCTFTGAAGTPEKGFLSWVEELKETDFGSTLRAATSKGGLNQEQYARLYNILGTIDEKDFSELPEKSEGQDSNQIIVVGTSLDPYLYIKGIAEEPTRGEWDFYCRDDGSIAVSASYDVAKKYNFDAWRLLDCPELYEFIVELNQDEKVPSDTPQAVLDCAERVLADQLAEHIQENGKGDRTELIGLKQHETGTAGLNDAVFIYRITYNLHWDNAFEYHQHYMALGYDSFTDEYTLLDDFSVDELITRYGTEELLAKYDGSMFVAAAMELYQEWLEENPEPSNPADALRLMGSEIGITLFERTWIPTHTLWLRTNSYDSLQFTALLQLLSGQSWVEVEQEVVTSDFRTTFVSPDHTKSLTIYSGSDGQVEYTCGGVTTRWRPAEKIAGADSDYALKAKEVYQMLEYHPNQVVQADDPLTAAKAFVESYAAERLNWSPGHVRKISDYRLLNWGLDEVSADGTAVVGWIEFAMLPDGNYDNFMVGGIIEGTGEYEGWVIDREGFMLVWKDDLWSCCEWGGGMGEGTLKYHGYTPMEEWEIERLWADHEYALCQVDGSETDYNVIAQSLAEQYAQCILNRFGWARGQVLDVQVKSTEVFDVYYGDENPNFCFNKLLYIKVTEEQRGYWEVGSGLGDPIEEGPYAGYYVHGMEVNARKLEDGNWHMTGMGTGGASVALPVSVDYATTKQLVELYFLTEGFTHDWLIVYRLGETPVEEVRKCLNELGEEQRQELTEALLYHVTTYPDYAIWKAEDL